MIKILDIWTKSQTFSPGALARVQAVVDSTGTTVSTGTPTAAGSGTPAGTNAGTAERSTTPIKSPRVSSVIAGGNTPLAVTNGGVTVGAGTGAGGGTITGKYSCFSFCSSFDLARRKASDISRRSRARCVFLKDRSAWSFTWSRRRTAEDKTQKPASVALASSSAPSSVSISTSTSTSVQSTFSPADLIPLECDLGEKNQRRDCIFGSHHCSDIHSEPSTPLLLRFA